MSDYFYDGVIPNYVSGTKSIKVDPTPASSTITLTDGTTTNTLTQADWTGNIRTVNTAANTTHFLNFSDNSSTGQGHPQKTAGISCNPFTNTITATTFVGSLTGASSLVTTVNNNADATNFITFVNTAGGVSLRIDNTTGPLTYNPNSGTLTASIFSGSASSVALTTDNSSVGSYFIPFSKTSTATANALFIDTDTDNLRYDPSTSTLNASVFKGKLTGAADSVVITDKNDAVTYYLTFTNAVGTAQALFVDSVTGPLTYDPSTSILTTTLVSADIQCSSSTSGVASFAGGTLSLNASGRTLRNFNWVLTGSLPLTLSTLTVTSPRNNGIHYVSITNNATAALTILTSLGANVKTKFTGPISVPAGAFAFMQINIITFNATITTIVDAYLVA